MSDEIAAWRAKRNVALMALDIHWAREHCPGASGDDVLLLALHKARYDCADLPPEARHDSGEWLRSGGYGRISGGEILPPGELPD